MTGQAGDTDHKERRYTLRQPAGMPARIIMPNHRSFAPCVVRDVSPTGAKLLLDESWVIPQAFWLRIEDDPVLRYYTVAWRTPTEVGVELASPKRKKTWTRDWSDLL
jgi:hypothetical protein